MGGRKFKTKETGEPSAAKKPHKQRKSRRSAVEEETIVQMDETIWKELPEELLENVIARVPVVTSIRFRLVCHKWNSLPFLQRPAPQELPLIYAVVSHGGYEKSGALYDHLVKKWYYISRDPPYYHWDKPRGDSGGLVCYAESCRSSFRVGNHLTQTWKVFPCSTSLSPTFDLALALVYNPSGASGYKIVWLKRGGNYGVHNYSSSDEKTAIIEGRIPDNFELRSPYEGLAIGSVVYFRCCKSDGNHGIMAYEVVSGTWEQLLIADPPNSRIFSLAEGGGRLLLVDWVDCNKNNNAAGNGIRPCVCVWELDTQTRNWIEVDRMPTSYCSEFQNNTIMDVRCLSNRKLLLISLSGRLLKRRTTGRELNEIFAYDVVSREWSKVPECIPPGCSRPQDVWQGISFFPSLSASPYE